MKKEYPRYCLKFKKNNKWLKPLITWSGIRISKRLNLTNAEKAYLKVAYSKTDYNDGYYTDEKELKTAWECFTDMDLVREYSPQFKNKRRNR